MRGWCLRDLILRSPCIKQCKLFNEVCSGCGRSAGEIKGWLKMSDSERMAIMNRLLGKKYTHKCPSCNSDTYCTMEAGKSANLCWCMNVKTKVALDYLSECLCKKCLTGDN